MKWRLTHIVVALSLTVGWFYVPAARAAQVTTAPQQITITATVPEMRMVVVDQNQAIRLVTSNTPNDVPPRVVLMAPDGPTVPMSTELRAQYEALMDRVQGGKVATITPAPEPLAELMPQFVNAARPVAYEVRPAASTSDPDPLPYWISVQAK